MLSDITHLLIEQQTNQQESTQTEASKKVYKQNEESIGAKKQLFKIEKIPNSQCEEGIKIDYNPFALDCPKYLNITQQELNKMVLEYMEILQKEEDNYIKPNNKDEAKKERKRKLERYREKRSRRCWDRTVIYDCRRHAAKKRLRVHGRFAGKNTKEKKTKTNYIGIFYATTPGDCETYLLLYTLAKNKLVKKYNSISLFPKLVVIYIYIAYIYIYVGF